MGSIGSATLTAASQGAVAARPDSGTSGASFKPTLTGGKPTYIGVPPNGSVRWELGTRANDTVLKGPNGTLYEVPGGVVMGGRDAIRAWAANAWRAGTMSDCYGTGKVDTVPGGVLTANEQALASNANAKRDGAKQALNELLSRWTQGQRTSIEQLPADINRLTDARLAGALNQIAQKHGYGNWTELLSPQGRSAVTNRMQAHVVQKVTGMTPSQLRQKATTTLNNIVRPLTGRAPFSTGEGNAKPGALKSYVDKVLQAKISERYPQFRGKVDSIDQLAYFQGTGALWNELAEPTQQASSGRYGRAEDLLSPAAKAQLEASAAQGTKTSARAYQAELLGGQVQAHPVEVGANGSSRWNVTWRGPQGETSFPVTLQGQFSGEQLRPGQFARNRIETFIFERGAQQRPDSVTAASFVQRGLDAQTAAAAHKHYSALRQAGWRVDLAWGKTWDAIKRGYLSNGASGAQATLQNTEPSAPGARQRQPSSQPRGAPYEGGHLWIEPNRAGQPSRAYWFPPGVQPSQANIGQARIVFTAKPGEVISEATFAPNAKRSTGWNNLNSVVADYKRAHGQMANVPPQDAQALQSVRGQSYVVGRPFDIEPFGNKRTSFQVLNERGQFDVYLRSDVSGETRLVWSQAGRPVGMPKDYSASDPGNKSPPVFAWPGSVKGSPYYEKLNATSNAMNAGDKAYIEAHQEPDPPAANNPLESTTRFTTAAVTRVERAFTFADLAAVMAFSPGDGAGMMPITPEALRGQQLNQQLAMDTHRRVTNVIDKVEDDFLRFQGVDPKTPEARAGRTTADIGMLVLGTYSAGKGAVSLLRSAKVPLLPKAPIKLDVINGFRTQAAPTGTIEVKPLQPPVVPKAPVRRRLPFEVEYSVPKKLAPDPKPQPKVLASPNAIDVPYEDLGYVTPPQTQKRLMPANPPETNPSLTTPQNRLVVRPELQVPPQPKMKPGNVPEQLPPNSTRTPGGALVRQQPKPLTGVESNGLGKPPITSAPKLPKNKPASTPVQADAPQTPTTQPGTPPIEKKTPPVVSPNANGTQATDPRDESDVTPEVDSAQISPAQLWTPGPPGNGIQPQQQQRIDFEPGKRYRVLLASPPGAQPELAVVPQEFLGGNEAPSDQDLYNGFFGDRPYLEATPNQPRLFNHAVSFGELTIGADGKAATLDPTSNQNVNSQYIGNLDRDPNGTGIRLEPGQTRAPTLGPTAAREMAQSIGRATGLNVALAPTVMTADDQEQTEQPAPTPIEQEPTSTQQPAPIELQPAPAEQPSAEEQPPTASIPQQTTTAKKPVLTKFTDVAGKLPQGAGWLLDNLTTGPASLFDFYVSKRIEESPFVQWLGNTPFVRTTGNVLNVPINLYRKGGRVVQNNPVLEGTFGAYKAAERQLRYFPQQLFAKKENDKQLRVADQAVKFYDQAARRVDGLVTESERLVREVQRQRTLREQALSRHDTVAAADAQRQIALTLQRLNQVQREAAKPLQQISDKASKQIDKGSKMLREQQVLRDVREREYQQTLQRDQTVPTPAVIAAKKRFDAANEPFALAGEVSAKKAAYEQLARDEAGTPAQADVLKKARLAYEEAKQALAAHTLAGNDPVLDIMIDRDDGLAQQLEQLRSNKAALDALISALQPQGAASQRRRQLAANDPNAAADNALRNLVTAQHALRDRHTAAEFKRDRLRSAEVVVKSTARIQERAVDAQAAESDLRGPLGRIGRLHSLAKDIFDGKGKGRIDGLSNKSSIEAASSQVQATQAEVDAWRRSIDQVDRSMRMFALARGFDSQGMNYLKLLRDHARAKLSNAESRLESDQRRLSLQQRAAEPRSIQVRVDNLRAKISASAAQLRKLTAEHGRIQGRLHAQVADLNTRIANTTDAKTLDKLNQQRNKLNSSIEANDYALQRAETIHHGTEELLPRAREALEQARQTAGLTLGKVNRNSLRITAAAALAAKALTFAQLSMGMVAPDTAADLRPLLKQMNLPGGEIELPLEAIKPIPGGHGVHVIHSAQGPQIAWRVRGTFSDVIVVAQPLPAARGSVMAALLNGGKVGTLSPSIQKGTDGVYLTIDSQRFALAGLTVSSVFHPDPTNTALNWWETVKLEVGALGAATRVNTASTNPRTNRKELMGEFVQTNSIKAPLKFKNIKLPGMIPFIGDVLQLPDGVGLAVTVKNSLGVGHLSLVYDPEPGVGQQSDRTSSWALKHNFRQLRPMNEWNPGIQRYGFFGTAIRIEKNYYAKYDPRNDGNWLMEVTKAPEAGFDWLTGKPLIEKLHITDGLQQGFDRAKPVLNDARNGAGKKIEEIKQWPVRTLEQWLRERGRPEPAPTTPQPSPQIQPQAKPSPQSPKPQRQPPSGKQNDPKSFLPNKDAKYGSGTPSLLLVGNKLAAPLPGLNVNPLRSDLNCLSTSMALDRQRAGLPAVALPNDLSDPEDLFRLYGRLPEQGFGAKVADRYLLPEGQRFDIGSLQQYIASLPEGARGIVLVNYGLFEQGHALLAEKMNGRVVFLDGQSGAVIDPKAISSGAVVLPDLLMHSDRWSLPDMPDVHYSFLRTDDVGRLEPVPAQVQDGIVVDVDMQAQRVLVADPVSHESRWISIAQTPYAASGPRLGENVYLLDVRPADGGARTVVRSQSRGLWTDPPADQTGAR